MNFSKNTDKIIYSHYLYGGQISEKVSIKSKLKVFTIESNCFNFDEQTATDNQYDLEQVTVSENSSNYYKILSSKPGQKVQNLADAKIIVAGGRGVANAENFKKLQNFVDKLSDSLAVPVSLAASRAAVDNGWLPHSFQVGQTGKTVAPDIYIACGVSGAVQHIAGMNRAKFVIAINSDAKAPIFNIANVRICGDIFTAIENIEKLLETS